VNIVAKILNLWGDTFGDENLALVIRLMLKMKGKVITNVRRIQKRLTTKSISMLTVSWWVSVLTLDAIVAVCF
jgi:hypothetical protein